MKLAELIKDLQKYEDQYGDSDVRVAFCYDKVDKNLYQYMGGIVTEVNSKIGVTLSVKEYTLYEREKK